MVWILCFIVLLLERLHSDNKSTTSKPIGEEPVLKMFKFTVQNWKDHGCHTYAESMEKVREGFPNASAIFQWEGTKVKAVFLAEGEYAKDARSSAPGRTGTLEETDGGVIVHYN